MVTNISCVLHQIQHLNLADNGIEDDSISWLSLTRLCAEMIKLQYEGLS